jgi:hypothetical protein
MDAGVPADYIPNHGVLGTFRPQSLAICKDRNS